MGRRTTREELRADALEVASAALAHVDIHVADVLENASPPSISAIVDDRPLTLAVYAVSYCTGSRARELLDRHDAVKGTVPLVVADHVTAEARAVLDGAGWSWFDRRGRLHLRGPAVRVDLDVPVPARRRDRGRTPPISSRSGVAIAYWLCDHPGEALSPTRHAPDLRVAPSTISTTVKRLLDAGLVDEVGRAVLPELFWELAAAWQPERTWLAEVPPVPQPSPDPEAPVWVRTGAIAAAAYGAPVVTTESGPVELYVPGPVLVSVSLRRHGAARPGMGAAVVAVAPAAPVVAAPSASAPTLDGWPAAPMLAVALDLAQDRSRGRQILSDWGVSDAPWR